MKKSYYRSLFKSADC